MTITSLQPAFSEYIPTDLDEGLLYVSMDYATATHLCACGCHSKIVTPLGRADWVLIFDGTVTLRPSIGNGQHPCRSHYLISGNRIEWLRPMSTHDTKVAGARDRWALSNLHRQPENRRSRRHRFLRWTRRILRPPQDANR